MAPFKMEYDLIRWGLGRNCRKIKQPLTSEPLEYDLGDQFAWHCEELTVRNGTAYPKTSEEFEKNDIDPRKFILKRIETSSNIPLKPADPDSSDEEFLTSLHC